MRLLRPMPPTLLPTASVAQLPGSGSGSFSALLQLPLFQFSNNDSRLYLVRWNVLANAPGQWALERVDVSLADSTDPQYAASQSSSIYSYNSTLYSSALSPSVVYSNISSSCSAAPLSFVSASTSPLWSFAGGSLLSLFSGPSSTPPALQLADQSLSSPVVVNGVPTWPWSQTLSVTTGSLSLSGSRTLYFAIPGWLMWQRNAAQSLVAFTDSVTVSSGNGPQQSVSYTVSVLQYDGFAPSAGVFAALMPASNSPTCSDGACASLLTISDPEAAAVELPCPQLLLPLPPPPQAAAAPAPARPSPARPVHPRPRPQLCCSARRRHRRRLPCTWEVTRAVSLTRASWCCIIILCIVLPCLILLCCCYLYGWGRRKNSEPFSSRSPSRLRDADHDPAVYGLDLDEPQLELDSKYGHARRADDSIAGVIRSLSRQGDRKDDYDVEAHHMEDVSLSEADDDGEAEHGNGHAPVAAGGVKRHKKKRTNGSSSKKAKARKSSKQVGDDLEMSGL